MRWPRQMVKDCLKSRHIAMRLLGRHYTELPEERKAGFVKMPVWIGRYAGIGFGAGIRAGVTIGKGRGIRPMAYINNDIPDFPAVKKDDQLRRWVEEWQNEDHSS